MDMHLSDIKRTIQGWCVSVWRKGVAFWNWVGPFRRWIVGAVVFLQALLYVISWFCGEPKESQGRDKRWVEGGTAIATNDVAPKLSVPKISKTIPATVPEKTRQSISFLTEKMTLSHAAGDFTNAVQFADAVEGVLANVGTNGLYHQWLSVLGVQIEEAFYQRDYTKTLELIDSMKHVKGAYVAETPCYRALHDVATLLRSGLNDQMYFSAVELGQLRKWERPFLEEYLSYLAAWGYLQPRMLDPRSRNQHTFYYEEYFGFDKPLPYRPMYRVVTTNQNGISVFSNETSVRWCGRRRYVSVDLDESAAKAMGLRDEEKHFSAIKLITEADEGGGIVKSHWSYVAGSGIATNSVCKIQGIKPWSPGMKSPITEPNTIYETATKVHVVHNPYIPIQVWIVIVALLLMAFGSPIPKDKKPEVPQEDRGAVGR